MIRRDQDVRAANRALARICRKLGRDRLQLRWSDAWGPGLTEQRADGSAALSTRLTGPTEHMIRQVLVAIAGEDEP